MRNRAKLLIGALALVSAVEVAVAQSDRPWDGVYAGANLGDASNNSCQKWTVAGGGGGGPSDEDLGNRTCASSDAFIGGVHVGENIQYEHFFGGSVEISNWKPRRLASKHCALPVPLLRVGAMPCLADSPRRAMRCLRLVSVTRASSGFPT